MYNIGQFRRPQLDSYSTPLEMELDNQESKESESDLLFYNTCGILSGLNIVNNQNCYYLRFGVAQRQDSVQNFSLKLYKSDETDDNEQLIDNFYVPRGTGVTYFETILAPNSTYNQIIWQLQRIALDYKILNADGQHGGRILKITNYSFTRLTDVITVLKSTYPNLQYLTKIGIQGPPSLLMCINKQPIRLGKNGIYELNNGINITSISFIPKESSNNLDYFIMDFQY